MVKIIIAIFLLFYVSPVFSFDELTGDTKLACEAIICLSTGQPPHECNPSLSKYFGINFDDWDDTFDARMDFLALCPSASDGSIDSGYRALLVNGTYQSCDKNYLLSRLNAPNCSYDDMCLGVDPLNHIPNYCTALSNHVWTIKYPMPVKINSDSQCFEKQYIDDGYMFAWSCPYKFNNTCYKLRNKSYFDEGNGAECRSFWN